VLAQRSATSVSLRIGVPQAFVDGQAQFLDVPPMLVGGRTMVPLRFVSQALGAGVAWDAASSSVLIASGGAAEAPPAAVPPSVSYPPTPYPPVQAYPPAPLVPATITGTVVRVVATTYPRTILGGDIQPWSAAPRSQRDDFRGAGGQHRRGPLSVDDRQHDAAVTVATVLIDLHRRR